jgi:cysteinyl-tRNA synthetase
MDWTQDKADQAKATLKKWYAQAEKDVPNSEPDIEVIRALSDDLNTAGAIAVLHRLSNENNESALRSSLQLLGLMGNNAPTWTKSSVLHANSYRAFHKILRRRHLAREQKQWAVADFIRDSFLELGVTLKDQEGGKVAPSTNFEFVEEYFRSLAEKESRELLGDSYKADGSMIAQSMADAYSIYAAEKVLSMIESKFPEEGAK